MATGQKFVRVASTTDIPEGKMIKVSVGNQKVLIARVGGDYCAINNACPHLRASLADGTIQDGIVTCPWHKAQFDVRTGQAVGEAKIIVFRTMPKNAETFEVKVEGTDILIR